MVVVVEEDQLAQAQVPGHGGRLGGHPLRQVAVAANPVGVVIDDGMAGPVEEGGQMGLTHGQAHGAGKALPQGAGGHLDAGGFAVLGMARALALPLAETFQLVEGKVIAIEVEQTVEQGAGMARREHKAIAIVPRWIGRVETQEAVPQNVGHVRRAHGGAGMAGFGLLHHVHGEHTNGVDAQLVQLTRHRILLFKI